MLPHKTVFKLAIPMLISSISVPLFGLVDTAILGHLDSPRYLAAVAIGSSIISFLLWGLGFLRMGTTSLTARRLGENNTLELKLLINQSLLIGAGLGLLLLLLSPWLVPFAVSLMLNSETLGPLSQEYIHIRLLSAPASLMNYAIIGWFIGLQNTRIPLLMALLSNGVNILLDVLLVLVLDLQVAGAAWASVAADFSGFGLGVFFILRHYRALGNTAKVLPYLQQWRNYGELFRVNRHLLVRTLALLASLSFFTAQGARFGEMTLAANAILMQLVHLCSYALDGFAHATEALVGKAYGSRKPKQFIIACKTTALWSIIVATVMVTGFHLLQIPLSRLFTNDAQVLMLVEAYYPWVLVLPIVSASCYFFDGVFIGAGKTRDMQFTMLAATFLVFLPAWWLSQSWGNHGLWLAFCAFNGARGLLLGLAFLYRHPNRWLTKSDQGT